MNNFYVGMGVPFHFKLISYNHIWTRSPPFQQIDNIKREVVGKTLSEGTIQDYIMHMFTYFVTPTSLCYANTLSYL